MNMHRIHMSSLYSNYSFANIQKSSVTESFTRGYVCMYSAGTAAAQLKRRPYSSQQPNPNIMCF